MFPYIILNGVSSKTINGLLIQNLPPITKPEMRVNIEEIDGRDGDIITDLGYAAYDKTFDIGITDRSVVDQVIGFFNSQGTVIFSNEPGMVYEYKIIKQIDFNKLIRFKTASVTLHVQPFKYFLTEKELEFAGGEQLLNIPDYVLTKNGIELTVSANVLHVSGTGTEQTTFVVPMDYLRLEPGGYVLYAFPGGSGANNCLAAVINDVATTGTCFGDGPIDLQTNKTVKKTDSFSTPKSFNYVYLNIPGNQAIDFSLFLKLLETSGESLKIINKGNVFALPKMTVFGAGDIDLGVNGKNIFRINLGLEEYLTIDTANLEASKDGTLKNRQVDGNYDDFRLVPGVNHINFTGIVEKILLEQYSRWL